VRWFAVRWFAVRWFAVRWFAVRWFAVRWFAVAQRFKRCGSGSYLSASSAAESRCHPA
jgi:hypothetical protein